MKIHKKRRYKIKAGRILFAALFILFIAAGVVAVVNLLSTQGSYAAAEREYDTLRLYAPETNDTSAPIINHADGVNPTVTPGQPDLTAINPDYVGWMRIDGTGIDYPVAQGQDNDRYLTTTFTGEKNPSGTIFMDSRCADGFDAPFAILYGHNMKNGTMFAKLNRYLEDGYLAAHPEISIVIAEGQTLIYRILAVNATDVYDKAYSLVGKDQQTITEQLSMLGMPDKTENVLALSTCTNGGNENERLLVYAVREENTGN